MTKDCAAIFDLGGVVIDWNPRYLYRKLFNGNETAMEYFLTAVCTSSWNAQQDARVFQAWKVYGETGRNAGCAGRGEFAFGMHEAAIADRRQREGESQLVPENADAKVDVLKGNSGGWSKIDFVEGRAVFIKCNLAVGTSIKIVENGARETAAGKMSEILDVDHLGRSERLMC